MLNAYKKGATHGVQFLKMNEGKAAPELQLTKETVMHFAKILSELDLKHKTMYYYVILQPLATDKLKFQCKFDQLRQEIFDSWDE